MVRLNDPRRQLPLTPSLTLSREQLHLEHAAGEHGPTSPPETPTTSPHMAGKPSQAGAFYQFSQPLAEDPNIKPVGNGHQFSYRRRVLCLEQLSPRSSSSSSDSDEASGDKSSDAKFIQPRSIAVSSMAELSDDQSDADDEQDDNDVNNIDDEFGGHEDMEEGEEEEEEEQQQQQQQQMEEDDGDGGGGGGSLETHQEARAGPSLRLASDSSSQSISAAGSTLDGVDCPSRPHTASSDGERLVCDFVIEEIDSMDSGCEGLEILYPTEIESNCSGSKSRYRERTRGMVRDFKNLNCSNEMSEDEDGEHDGPGVDAEVLFRQRQREIRRMRRMSMSSSFGKRTHSEISDSGESDVETMDVNDVGSSARRMRKRLQRGSLYFQDPPAPRIDELEEPDSSEEEFDAADPLARELPYWTMEIMEMDSA